jgi:hypothetical protein
LKVIGVQDLLEGRAIPPEVLRLYGASSEEGKNRDPREKDFILILPAKGESSWILRGITPFANQQESEYQNLGMAMELRAEKERKWKYLNAAPPFRRLKFEEYRKGYRLYQVKDPSTLMPWKGRWMDGWIGEKARLSLYPGNSKEDLLFQGSVFSFALPNSLTIRREGRVLKKVELREPGNFSFGLELESSPGSPVVEIEITAGKTFIPKELGLNPDQRILSVQISAKRKDR